MTTTHIKVTLSERPPVSIAVADWPIIASSDDHDGKVECQANTKWYIKVREHADGRRLVYCSKDAGNGGQHAGFRGTYGGWLLAVDAHVDMAEQTIRAIRRCAGLIERDDLGAECIGDLPAEEL
jgi:hypothetical protein